jgi:DMSO/TMAO reductase YedYZ molybdopterin-dependent catalytic subunit
MATMSPGQELSFTRRRLLRQSLLCAGVWLSGFHPPRLLSHRTVDSAADGTLLAVVPFSDEGNPPMGEPIGSELDGRLFTDLSTVVQENPTTPTDHFFIRTRASRLLDVSSPWTIQVGGEIEKPLTIAATALAKKARPMGTHLIECSGNPRRAHFGMMSIARWDGVPLQEGLELAKPKASGVRVLVSGFDQYEAESTTSVPGASWVFSSDQLFSSGAFLATKMNGQALQPDHGAPVRLVVPGWYGCVCIKWVNQIEFGSNDTAATSQMQEYANRTMQIGVPSLARDYQPALVDLAAMPTRIEKWLVGGKIQYRVVGIQWGGSVQGQELEMRFNPGEAFVRVASIHPFAEGGFSIWSHQWAPPRTGRFTIRLRLRSAQKDARRLDSGYYDRSVEITEI